MRGDCTLRPILGGGEGRGVGACVPSPFYVRNLDSRQICHSHTRVEFNDYQRLFGLYGDDCVYTCSSRIVTIQLCTQDEMSDSSR